MTPKDLSFYVIYGTQEVEITLSNYETVGELKMVIHRTLAIPPSKQVIDCWYKSPKSDDTVLDECCNPDSNYLVLYNLDKLSKLNRFVMEGSQHQDFAALENCAAADFVEYFSNNFDDRHLLFHICRLEDAMTEACFTNLQSRQILILYLHNGNDNFAKTFGENLGRPKVKDVMQDKFFLLGWNVENDEYHPALIEALSSHSELSALVNFIKNKTCSALLIVPVKNSFTLFCCMKGKISNGDFLDTLKRAKEFFITENETEQDLSNLKQSSNDLGSTRYQQLMLDMLGDRDYDSFDYFEFDELKKKIGFAFYGPPEEETGYTEKQDKKIESLFKVIVEQNNIFTKWKDRIIISFIYNCIEPLPSEKKKRAKKYEDYNPNTDLAPTPLFVLRKCKNSENPCRIIIDDSGRVYKTWQGFVSKNKLAKCEMILPLNGRYQADENGNVLLERHLSPACGIDVKILQGADITNTAVGLVSGGILIAAAIPAITIAPVALAAAGLTGIGVGLYSLGRGAYTLYDRKKHKETLSFVNAEARGAYFGIVAASLGFVGAGAHMAVSQLAARGFNIGEGASAAVNFINVANLGASGASIVNSGYDVFDQWWSEQQAPSLLTIVQLSSAVLFFGHAVYNFKPASAIIEEAQTRTLRDYQESLRSNKHRKTFTKLMKETINRNDQNVPKGQAEVIKTIVRIANKDEVFATLSRLNKQMNKNDVKFSADNGEIKLNGVSVDMKLFGSMDKKEVGSFLNTLPTAAEPPQAEVNVLRSRLEIPFNSLSRTELLQLAGGLWKIFSNTSITITEKIIDAVSMLLNTLIKDMPGCFRELCKMFPGVDKYMKLFGMTAQFFKDLIDRVEQQYQQWLETKDPKLKEPIFVTLSIEYSKRVVEIFCFVSKTYFLNGTVTEMGLKELMRYFFAWFTKQAVEYGELMERKQERTIHSGSPARKVQCPDCGGIYYH